MAHEVEMPVTFRHCDPAGIVYYPRYFEMIADAVEFWFAARADTPYRALHSGGVAVPTVTISATFSAPSRLGDVLTVRVEPVRLGRTSVDFRLQARCGEEARFAAQPRVVYTRDGRSQPWPEALADAIRADLAPAEQGREQRETAHAGNPDQP